MCSAVHSGARFALRKNTVGGRHDALHIEHDHKALAHFGDSTNRVARHAAEERRRRRDGAGRHDGYLAHGVHDAGDESGARVQHEDSRARVDRQLGDAEAAPQIDDRDDAAPVLAEEHELRPMPGVGGGARGAADAIVCGLIRRDAELIAVLDDTVLFDTILAAASGTAGGEL